MPSESIKNKDSVASLPAGAAGELRESARKGRIFSSYLFTGPEGTGRFVAALDFAKAVNCTAGKNAPCEACDSCRKIASLKCPDVFIAGETCSSLSVGVDTVREIIRRTSLKPYEARKKVFIVRHADSMNAASSNAFLKTLEEPPEDTVFILISRSKELLLPTIVSRCYVINFLPLPSRDIKNGGAFPESPGQSAKDFEEEISSYSGREEFKEKLDALLSFFRDVFIYKTTKLEKALLNTKTIDAVKEEAKTRSLEELEGLIKRIITLRSHVDYNVNTKIIASVLLSDIRKHR